MQVNEGDMKKYGIQVTLPENDPMAQSHLLGEGWTGYRWFDTMAGRDEAMADMLRSPGYYRVGDQPSVILTPVERDEAE
jgi:hypothetical protein